MITFKRIHYRSIHLNENTCNGCILNRSLHSKLGHTVSLFYKVGRQLMGFFLNSSHLLPRKETPLESYF